MSSKKIIFLVSALSLIFAWNSAQAAVTFIDESPTLSSGLNFIFKKSGYSDHLINYDTYSGTSTRALSALLADYATNAGSATFLDANGSNCAVGQYARGVDASGNAENCTAVPTGTVSGSGTANYIPKWTSTSGLGNSLLYDNGTNVGIGLTSMGAKLDVNGAIRSNNQLISTLAAGTAPLAVTSNTLVTNLNADLLDGNHAAVFTTKNDVADLGTVTFNQTGTTTADFITKLEELGAFDNYHSMMKATWSYAGNADIMDTGFGALELAGCVVETWTDNADDVTRGNIHVRVTRPTTGSGGSQILVYNDQGSGYSPGWRQIWNSATDGSGSGLDADLWDGYQFSSYLNQAVLTTSAPTFTDLTLNGGDLTINNNNGGINFNDSSAYWLKTATNWGIYWDTAANQLRFNGGGATKSFIDLDDGTAYFNGNVGIGTSNPSSKLHVIGSINSTGTINGTGLCIASDCRTSWSSELWSGTKNGSIWNGDAGVGNVGIGITNPLAKMHVNGGSFRISSSTNQFATLYMDGNGVYFEGAGDTAATNRIRFQNSNRGGAATYNGFMIGENAVGSGSGIQFYTGGYNNNRMVINETGNVGVGTTTPGSKLHVRGDANDLLTIDRGVNGASTIRFLGANGGEVARISHRWGPQAGVGNALDFNLASSNVNVLRLGMNQSDSVAFVSFPNGNVGIGTTNPGDKLEIDGANNKIDTNFGGQLGIKLKNTNNTNGNYTSILNFNSNNTVNSGIYFKNVDHSTEGRIDFITRDSSGWGPRMVILGNGNVGIGTTNPGSSLHVVGGATIGGNISAVGGTFGTLAGSGTRIVIADTSGNISATSTAVATGLPSPSGNIGSTLRSDGTSWLANSIIYNNGTNVGIGTTNPQNKLEVNGNIYLSPATPYGGVNNFNAQKEQNVNGTAVVGAAGWYRVAHIDTTNGRGQNTVTVYTTGGSYVPRSTTIRWFHDWGTASGINAISEMGSSYWNQARVTNDGTKAYLEIYFTQAITVYLSMQYDGGFVQGALYDGTLTAGSGTVETTIPLGLFSVGNKVLVDTSGNVGIGTTNPGGMLQIGNDAINPTIILESTSDGSNAQQSAGLEFGEADSARGSIWYTGDGYMHIGMNNRTKEHMRFSYSATSTSIYGSLYLNGATTYFPGGIWNTTSSVGIGKTNPAYKLDVSGDIRATGNIYANGKIITSRYGHAGTYDSAQVQGIWSIGDAYKIDTNNNNFGSQYGMVYAYTDAGTSGVKKPIAGFGHQILFVNNGEYKAAISSQSGHAYFAGNVGIGTTNPSDKLQVVGGINATSINSTGIVNGTSLCVAGDCKTDWASVASASGWTVNGTSLYKTDTTGNVGVGTTAPETKFHIDRKALTGLTDLAIYDVLKLSNTNPSSATAPKGSNFTIALSRWQNPANNYPRTRVDFKTTGLTTDSNATPNTIMSLRDDGKIGIGTTNPATSLDVMGGTTADVSALTLRSNAWTCSQTVSLDFVNGSSRSLPTSRILSQMDTCGADGDNMQFQTATTGNVAPTTKLIIKPGGNVGIGTTNPLSTLHVVGKISVGDSVTTSTAIRALSLVSTDAVARFMRISSDINAAGPSFELLHATSASAAYDSFWDVAVSGLGMVFRNRTSSVINALVIKADGNIGIASTSPMYTLSVGNLFGVNSSTGKVTAAIFDPPYTIDGQRYATYLPGMIGIKEETTAVIALNCQNNLCSKTIDFKNLSVASDLWLFARITDLPKNFDQMSVILTPNFEGRAWYEKDRANTLLTIMARPTQRVANNSQLELSYRLTAPRFDYASYGNIRGVEDQMEGINLDKLLKK